MTKEFLIKQFLKDLIKTKIRFFKTDLITQKGVQEDCKNTQKLKRESLNPLPPVFTPHLRPTGSPPLRITPPPLYRPHPLLKTIIGRTAPWRPGQTSRSGRRYSAGTSHQLNATWNCKQEDFDRDLGDSVKSNIVCRRVRQSRTSSSPAWKSSYLEVWPAVRSSKKEEKTDFALHRIFKSEWCCCLQE